MSKESDTPLYANAATDLSVSAAQREPVEPSSPCISVCALDENDICLGCFRSSDEITDWFMADATEKRAILARAELRRSEAHSIKLG